MKYLLTVVYATIFSSLSFAQTIESHFINFDFDSFVLDKSSENIIQTISNDLLEKTEYTIEIIGHTDQDGSLEYNRILAEQRAKEVYTLMLEQGISLKNVQYTSHGEQALLIPKSDDISKSKNRRVEIKTHIVEINNLSELISLLDEGVPEQLFNVSHNKASTIQGKEGSIIEIPENAFVFEDGTVPNGTIQVEIIEAFDFNAFAENSLSCNSGDALLESGGMMKITATAEGRELQIKEGKELDVTYPKSKIKKDMKLFYAERQTVGANNWILADSEIETNLVDTETSLQEIDMQQFKTELLQRPVAPKYKFKRIPSKPRYPSYPIKPFNPIEPEKDKTRLDLSTWQKLTLSPSKKETLKEQKYQENYAKYEQKVIRYKKLIKEYEQAIIDHQVAIKNTDRKIEEWYDLCRTKYSEVYQYQIALKKYSLMEKMWFAQNNLLLKEDIPNNEKSFWAFYNLTNRKTYVGEIRPKLEKVFGSNFKELFKDIPHFHGFHKFNTLESPNYKIAKEMERKANSTAYRLGFLDQDNMTSNSLGNYAMTVANLGWINCDRFINIPIYERRQIALVHEKETKFYLVFNDMKSMLIAKNEGSFHQFKGLPKDTNVTIVGVQVRDNQPYLFSKAITTTENVKLAPTFKKSSVAEISHIFSELDKRT